MSLGQGYSGRRDANQGDPLKQAESAASTVRPSACPGLLRIVQSGDGGLCRIKLPCGRLHAHQARAVAAAARQHASGVIEATNRANLQIRGVRPGAEGALIETLLAADLGAPSPGADDLRNLMVSPLLGLEPGVGQTVAALAERLLALLQDTPRFHALSPKFALLLDGGEPLAMLEHPHDIWLAALGPQADAPFAFGLAGCPPQRADDAPALGAVPAAQVPALVEALLQLFLDRARPEQTRMRHLLADLGPAALVAELERRLGTPLQAVPDWRRDTAAALGHLGPVAGRHAGAAAPLGRLDAAQLDALADLADQQSDGQLRLTPWQSVLLPAPRDLDGTLAALAALGLVTDATAPLARLIACTGSAGCPRSLADTKADALALAPRLPPEVQLHLTGCPRSCAAAHVAPYTLLARAPGRYDLYQRARDGFGRLLASDLDLEQASDRLAATPDSWSSSE